MSSRKRYLALLVAALASLLALTALAAPPGADAKPKHAKKGVPVKVMTRNIFIGARLDAVLNSQSFPEFTAANGQILHEVDRADFPRRSIGLAQEIKQTKPDLIGLQEAAWWRTGPPPTIAHPFAQGPNGEFTALENRYDFLTILLDALRARGLHYKIGVVKNEFDFEAPTDYDGDPNTGLFGGEVMARLTVRDVILVNRDSKVHTKLKNPQSGTYQNLFTPTVSGIAVPITHGWTAGDVTVSKRIGQKKVKAKFRFVNSQFESLNEPSIRAKQAQELLEGPAARKRTIILGSFYSNVPGVMAGDEQAYQTLLDGGFRERSIDQPSCCVNLFTSPPSEFDHQVDHVMTNMGRKAKLLASEVTGREQRNGIYDSPHAGIFSKLKVK
jgi:hypothetical protein